MSTSPGATHSQRERARAARNLRGRRQDCGYFALHATADIYHSNIWREQLEKRIVTNPEKAEAALDAAENAARMLWQALDGIQAARLSYAM